MAELGDRIRSEASIASRAGSLGRLEAIADEVDREYARGFDAGVDAMRAYAAEWESFEDGLYNIALGMGFTGVGLGKRHAILQAFEALARRTATDKADRAPQA